MLAKDVPSCICCQPDPKWSGGGGSFGPGGSQSNFSCSCGRAFMHISRPGGHIGIITRKPLAEGEKLDPRIAEWIDRDLSALWAHHKSVFKKKVDDALDILKENTDPVMKGHAAKRLAELGAGGPLSYQAFPILADPAQADLHETMSAVLLQSFGQWDTHFREDRGEPDREKLLTTLAEGSGEVAINAKTILNKIERYKEEKKNLYYQEGRNEAPLPAKVPGDLVVAFLQMEEGWDRINPEQTQDIEIPPHPRRVNHDKYWKEIFETLEKDLDLKIERKEIKNGYGGDTYDTEPWYEFEIGAVRFRTGPRKRVFSIRMDSPVPFDVIEIRDLAKEHQTTYMAGGGHQSDLDTTREATVHAWGKEKLVDYLKIVIRSAQTTKKPTQITTVHALFHRLWGKASDGPDYNKDQWMTLQRVVEQNKGYITGINSFIGNGEKIQD